jgi:hypothetical protein
LADILNFSRKIRDRGLSPTGPTNPDSSTACFIQDLKCGRWTTRKLKIPTSTSGYIVIECFESADGKRLKGLGAMEPEFCLANLAISVENAYGYDELKLFLYDDFGYPETDFMSHVVNYTKPGSLIVLLSLKIGSRIIQHKLWF